MTRTWAVVALAAALSAGACTSEPTSTLPESLPADEAVNPTLVTTTPTSSAPTGGIGSAGYPEPSSVPGAPADELEATPSEATPGVDDTEGSPTADEQIDTSVEDGSADDADSSGEADAGTETPGEPDTSEIEQLLAEIDQLLADIGADLDGLDDDLDEVADGLNTDEGDIE